VLSVAVGFIILARFGALVVGGGAPGASEIVRGRFNALGKLLGFAFFIVAVTVFVYSLYILCILFVYSLHICLLFDVLALFVVVGLYE
jgi:hypothetical protein